MLLFANGIRRATQRILGATELLMKRNMDHLNVCHCLQIANPWLQLHLPKESLDYGKAGTQTAGQRTRLTCIGSRSALPSQAHRLGVSGTTLLFTV